MPRHTRKGLNTSFFHVVCQGLDKEFIFNDSELKNKYLDLMKKHIDKVDLEVICYCIMSNHVHILIYTEEISQLSKYMKCVNTEFAQYYNQKKDRVGFVFRDRFKSQVIHNKKYLYQCINYIHMNPVKAGIVKCCGDYLYSSYNDFCKGIFLKKKDVCSSINVDEIRLFDRCIDFFDVDYDVREVIDEYVKDYCEKNNTDIATVRKDKEKSAELIRLILEPGIVKKKDIQNILKFSFKRITQALDTKKS